MSDSSASSPKTPRAKAAKFEGLSFNPHITACNGVSCFHCDYTMAQIPKRAGIPCKSKDGSYKLLGAFMDYHCVAGYLAEQLAAKKIDQAQYDTQVRALCEYLGVDAVEVPTMSRKELVAFGGKQGLAAFTASYSKKRVDAGKYRTPEQDRAAAEAKKQATANKPADDSRKPLQVYAKESRVGGIKSIGDLLSLHDDDKQDKVHAWVVAAVPSEENRFAIKRVGLDKEKDKDLLDCVGAGLSKQPGLAGLPPKNAPGRGPILVVPRSVKIGEAAAATKAASPSPAKKSRKSPSPAASRKRKDSVASDESGSASSSPAPSKVPKKPARTSSKSPKPQKADGKQGKPAKKQKRSSSVGSGDESSDVSSQSSRSSQARSPKPKKAGKASDDSAKKPRAQPKSPKRADPQSDSEASSVSSSPKPHKPRKELTAEQKAAAKAKRLAKKLAAAAASAAAAMQTQ